jgi:hypothetical protein
MLTLEYIINEMYGTGNVINQCTNPKIYTVKIGEVDFTFVAPSNDKVTVANYNKSTENYYLVVAGLLLEHFDILVDDVIVIGSHNIHRAKAWKVYDDFLSSFELIQAHNLGNWPRESFESKFIATGESVWDNLLQYMEDVDQLDQYDIAEFITPTFKQRLESELVQRRLIKGMQPTATLF